MSDVVDVQTEGGAYLLGLKTLLDSIPLDKVSEVVDLLRDAREHRSQVFIAGNGGSASTASHMACDLAKTVMGNGANPNPRFRVIALTDNVPLLTAWGNDVSFDYIFSEQIRNLANSDDVLIVITVSGNSPNIVEAVRVAKELGVRSVGLLGFDGGQVADLVDCAVVVRSENFGHVEDVHMVLNHLMTAYFRKSGTPRAL